MAKTCILMAKTNSITYTEISQYQIPILGYPITSFLDWVIQGYPGINTMSGYPGISLDNPSCRFSRWRSRLSIVKQGYFRISYDIRA